MRTVRVLTLLTACAIMFLWFPTAHAQNPPMSPEELAEYVKGFKEEPSLQQILNLLGYGYINVPADETGIELFPTIEGGYCQVLYAEEAGYSDITSSGWYPQGEPADTHIVFTGDNVPGDSVSFSVAGTDSFGLYLNPEEQAYVWYTETDENSDSWDHAWIFPTHDSRKFIVGWEDWPENQADFDYNDLVVLFCQPNQAPVITCPDTQWAVENKVLKIPIFASDPDAEDLVQLTVLDLPPGADFTGGKWANPASEEFKWLPGHCDAGVYTVTFIAADDYDPLLADTCQVVIVVDDVNQKPGIVCPDTAIEVDEGDTLIFAVLASDPDVCDGDLVTISSPDLPSGATLIDGVGNPASGTFTWRPPYTAAPGPYVVTFIATDDHTPPASNTCQVVINVNDVPMKAEVDAQTDPETVQEYPDLCLCYDYLLRCYIELHDPDSVFTALDILVSSVVLVGENGEVYPVPGLSEVCDTCDHDHDGIVDIMVPFDLGEVIDAVVPRDRVGFTLTGSTKSQPGQPGHITFAGSDSVFFGGRCGCVSGVVGEEGNHGPLSNILVEILREVPGVGDDGFQTMGADLTDEAGAYVITYLVPGDYVIRLSSEANIMWSGTVQVVGGETTSFDIYLGSVSLPEGGVLPIPIEFGLSQNHPNPFNPATEIAYALPNGGPVRLEIYNLLGQRVATLVDEMQQAGYKTIRWDAHSFPGGVYFCHITAGNFVETRKMVLLK